MPEYLLKDGPFSGQKFTYPWELTTRPEGTFNLIGIDYRGTHLYAVTAQYKFSFEESRGCQGIVFAGSSGTVTCELARSIQLANNGPQLFVESATLT